MNFIRIAVQHLVVIIIVSGCAVGPDYHAPAISTPKAWHTALRGGLNDTPADTAQLANWWNTLNDPLLVQLIQAAVANNLDLKQAQARLREARARRGASEAERFPTLAVQAGANRNRSSGKMGGGGSLTSDTFSAGFDANWELDIFGGKRRAVEAAEASLDAAREDLRDVLVSLVAEVALNYVEARSFQARFAVADASLATLSETWQIARWRREAGLTTQLDEDQAKLNLEQTRAQLPVLLTGREQAKNRLAVLLGRQSGTLAGLEAAAAIPSSPPEVAVGVPAEVLRQRPDIRRAERQLAAATAQVGVATAARYPNFSLTGTLGLQALSAPSLLQSSAGMFALGSNAAWTLFDAGRIRQNIEIQNALQEQALIRYEAAVLDALRDVENALVAYAEEQNRRQALKEAVHAAQSAARLAGNQYAAGLIDFLTVLDSQRSTLSLQDQLIQSEAAVTANLTRLYKALGGGWNTVAPDTPAAAFSAPPGEKS
jgi:NodT family efflux transporter outer membrane factor (OMF) lipoprotein